MRIRSCLDVLGGGIWAEDLPGEVGEGKDALALRLESREGRVTEILGCHKGGLEPARFKSK